MATYHWIPEHHLAAHGSVMRSGVVIERQMTLKEARERWPEIRDVRLTPELKTVIDYFADQYRDSWTTSSDAAEIYGQAWFEAFATLLERT